MTLSPFPPRPLSSSHALVMHRPGLASGLRRSLFGITRNLVPAQNTLSGYDDRPRRVATPVRFSGQSKPRHPNRQLIIP